MLHELYEDMDPEYRSSIFFARKKLLGSIESNTILPDYDLRARGLLNDTQLDKVHEIRQRRLTPVIDRFQRD